VRFYYLQVIEGDKWSKRARYLHETTVSEPARRGTFYSNVELGRPHPEQAQALAIDIPKFHLYADPRSIPLEKRGEISEILANIIDMSSIEKQYCLKQLKYKSRSRKLKAWLDQNSRDKIKAWWLPYARSNKIARNALYFTSDYKRSYPYNSMLGQVLHTIRDLKNNKNGKGIPTGGLEYYFNDSLSGKNGHRKIIRSLRHPLEKGEVTTPPKDGDDIYLTINHVLQAISEEELEIGVKNAQAKGGWAIVMNPHNGEILSLAQYPFFNPKDYKKYFGDKELVKETRSKAIMNAYEPGSVMKPITLSIAFAANRELKDRGEEPLFDPLEKIDTSDGHFPGRSKLLKDGRQHHYLNMYQALQKSSNVYMANIALRIIDRLGAEWYRQKLEEMFGIGLKTGISYPNESPGMLPTPHKLYANGLPEWSKPTPYSLAIGYNLQLNTIQIAQAYSVFANGGKLIQPKLIKQIGPEKNNPLLSTKSEKQILESDEVKHIVKGMKYVTKYGGTSPLADVSGYTEAGKSGTPEKIIDGRYSQKIYLPRFAGFILATDPKLVIVVVIDEPAHVYLPGIGKNWNGGVCAAPVFHQIAKRSLEYLGVPPDDPYGYPYGDPRRDYRKADWVTESENLRENYKEWNE